MKTDSTVPSDSPWRGIVAVSIVTLSMAWFGVGLLAPLTPSLEPVPFQAVLLFSVFPAVSIALVGQLVRAHSTRWFIRALSCLVVVVTIGIVALLGIG